MALSRSFFVEAQGHSPEDIPVWERRLLTLPGFLIAVGVLTVGSVSVAFVLFPLSNPLTEPNVWQCALACSAVWVPITILFVALLLQEIVYRPLGQRIPVKSCLVMWFIQSFFMSSVLILLPYCWVNPAPMNGVFGATLGMIMNAVVIFFVFVPRLGESAGLQRNSLLMRTGNPIYELQRASLAVLLFFVGAVIQLITMLTSSAFLLYVDNWWVSALVLPMLRCVFLKALGGMAQYLRHDARVLGTTMACVTVGIANAIAVGSASTWQFTVILFLIDLAQAAFAAIAVADVSICGRNISELLLLKEFLFCHVCVRRKSLQSIHEHVPPEEKDAAKHRLVVLLIAAELAEVVVAMNFSLGWLVVRVGPNTHAFSGSGTSDFGLRVPDSTLEFLANIIAMFVLELLSFVVIKQGVKRCCGVNLDDELTTVLRDFGPVMAAMSTWLIVTAFCYTMIHCGLDFSLEWDYL